MEQGEEDYHRVGGLMLLTQPNLQGNKNDFSWHLLPLLPCCPISGNPQKGSTLAILYKPSESFLEVYSLRKYIDSFIGGTDLVRDMEGMIQVIANTCTQILNVPVTVGAFIKLQKADSMIYIAQGTP